MRCFCCGAELRERQLWRSDALALPVDPARGHDLDARRAVLQLLADGTADSILAVDLSGDPTRVTAGHRDRPTRGLDPRSFDDTGLDSAGHIDRDRVRRADVADRRHARAEVRMCV